MRDRGDARILRAALCCAVAFSAAISSAGAADLEAGRKKVRSVCQVCHGMNGIGTNPTVPNLAGESEMYISKQLKAFRSGTRTHEQMSIIAQGLSDADIANAAAYFSAIKVTATPPK